MFNHLTLNKPCITLLSAQVISLLGTGVSSVCLALLAYELAGSDAAWVLSVTFAIKMLTYIFLSPVFAHLAKGVSKRRSLISLDLVRALLFVLIPFVSEVWQVYVLMFCINACSAWFTPQFQSVLPQVCRNKAEYVNALSISRLAFDLEQMLSPILAAVLLGIMSFRMLFLLDSMSFIVSAGLIFLCLVPQGIKVFATNAETADQGSDQDNKVAHTGIDAALIKPTRLSFRQEFKIEEYDAFDREKAKGHFSKMVWLLLTQGITDYLAKPQLKSLWLAYLAAASASAMVLVNTVVYVHEILNGGETQTALAMMFVGLGSMVVAIALPRWLRRFKLQYFHWIGMVMLILAFFIGATTPNWSGYLFLCVLMGVGMSCIQTTAGLIIVDVCGDKDTAPYFAAHFSLTHFWWLITYLAAGISASVFGLSYSYIFMAAICCLSLWGYYCIESRVES